MNSFDTIAAIATGTGGAVNIIRISGKNALAVADKVWRGKKTLEQYPVRTMSLGRIVGAEGDLGEPALAVFMKHPHSYTGDDVVELQCHGGMAAAGKTLHAVLHTNLARLAEPGEFTFRSFINGKIDLTQAEAVGDLVSAQSEISLDMASRQLSGVLSREIKALREQLYQTLAECESHLDFPDENLEWKSLDTLDETIFHAVSSVGKLLDSFQAGSLLRDGVRIVLAGRPNAGKSSLLNRLLGCDRAIVSNIPGTTRDTLEEYATLRNIPVKLIDTAGLRESADELENIGVERSRRSLRQAEIIFWVFDLSSSEQERELELSEFRRSFQRGQRGIAVWNKRDLCAAPIITLPELGIPSVALSATTGEAMEQLLDLFEQTVWNGAEHNEPEVAVNARHCRHLERTLEALSDVSGELHAEHWELAAVGLHGAIAELSNITGETANPDILDEIFSRFCIGK